MIREMSPLDNNQELQIHITHRFCIFRYWGLGRDTQQETGSKYSSMLTEVFLKSGNMDISSVSILRFKKIYKSRLNKHWGKEENE